MIYKILLAVITGVAITFAILFFVQGCNNKKEVASLNKQLNDCLNAPVKETVKIVNDTIRDTIWRRPRIIHDTITIVDYRKPELCKRQFSDVYKYMKGDKVGKIAYDLSIVDCDPIIHFPQIELPVEYHYITKTVDTCINKAPQYKPKNHIFLFAGTGINNFHSFPIFDLGIGFSFKDRWSIMPGVLYNPSDSKLYGTINFGFYLR